MVPKRGIKVLAVAAVLVVAGSVYLQTSASFASSKAASPARAFNIFTGTGISDSQVITTGPDKALWFTSQGSNSSGG